MKNSLYSTFAFAVAIAASFSLSNPATAQNTSVTQTVSITVSKVYALAIAGSPNLTINTAVGGPDGLSLQAANATSQYARINNAVVDITAELDSELPDGLVLEVQFSNDGGPADISNTHAGVSTGLATDLSAGASTGSINYTLTADPSAGAHPPLTRTVTFTITG